MAWSPPRQIKGSPDSIARPTSRSMRSHGSEAPLNWMRSEEHTSELQSQSNLVCRLLLEKKKNGPSLPDAEFHNRLFVPPLGFTRGQLGQSPPAHALQLPGRVGPRQPCLHHHILSSDAML